MNGATLKARFENIDNILKHKKLRDLVGLEFSQELNSISFPETKKIIIIIKNTLLYIILLEEIDNCTNAYIFLWPYILIHVAVAYVEIEVIKILLAIDYVIENKIDEHAFISIEQDFPINYRFWKKIY